MHIANISLLTRLILFLLLTATVVFAQDDAEPSPTASPSGAAQQQPASTPSPSPAVVPKLITLFGNLELDDIVEVHIDNLEKWAQAQTETNDPMKLVPYINGRAIKGNYPEELHLERGRLIYHLQIIPDNKDVWVDLLGAPSGVRRPVTLSVGLENGSAFDSVHERENPIPLTVISPAYGAVAALVILVTLGLLLWLVRKTNIIREPGPPPISGKKRPYNLGRAQMAFWFFLIYASYMTIWLITGALDTITASLLALMGISAGTALSEAMIDSGKLGANAVQLQSLSAEKQSLEQTIPELQTQIDALNAKTTLSPEDTSNRDSLIKQVQDRRARLALINPQLEQLAASADAAVSKGFIRDILRDASGYSFHRFQIFAWTIVLGIIFVSSVYNNLTMPEFSATLLGLMGLSSGTYIGFKFPEKQ